ncbi:hypothetical protein K458DRAFT_131110 [Lentithecium fluviatile CBS 122367]|uniref:Uncharacterized protein n=1 Tax=Lentithecium fluviatile CBS 122367 TaxID=1168545 RepID=A0A6G1JGW7_9PLEO|nr:hypothetical protein K458DRAFT_131110 [Lentithecium fluviatile CBS 122367]
MSLPTTPAFKPPPVVECMSREHCLGFGKKIYVPNVVCSSCLKRHDPQQLREWAQGNSSALHILDEEFAQKQQTKRNLEARGRYLCAFEDPDYTHCRWRRRDLNLRGTRMDCGIVRRKGTACVKCWRRHLHKIGIVQYFTPMGLCHEEADKAAEASKSKDDAVEDDEDDEDDDVEGYNQLF